MTKHVLIGDELRQMQFRMLDILTDVDRVCRKQNLTYYLLAGTMLGAVRHGGFIPWDDDIDIGMPRADYDRFFRIAPTCLPAHLEAKDYTSDPTYPHWFMKVEDKRTTLIQKKHIPYKGGVYVDIFPLDGEAGKGFEQRSHLTTIKYLSKLRNALYRDPFKHGHGPEAWATLSLQRLFDRQHIQRKLDAQLRKYDYQHSEIISDHDTGTMPKAYLGNPTPISFEGRMFLGVENPDNYLKSLYGDYMQLPPVEKRRQHGFHYLDMNTPYQNNPIDKQLWPNQSI